MAINTTSQPVWYSLSHHDRYKRLNKVRRVWNRCHYGRHEDFGGRTVHLDGTWINDVPSFYLSLGEAVNGPNGYFGGSLDALSDCLCGRFGVLPPLTIRLSHFDEVRHAMHSLAWCRFRAEGFQEAVAGGERTEHLVDWGFLGDGSDADIARWTAKYEAVLAGKLLGDDEIGSYFDAILEVLEESRSALVPVPPLSQR